MDSKQQHIISKCEYQLEFKNSKPQNQQDIIGRLHYDQIIPALEEVLNRCIKPDEHIVIDRLELDLGNISLKELKDTLLSKLENEISTLYSRVFYESKDNGLREGTVMVTKESTNVLLFGGSENNADKLFYFLKYGIPSWKEVDAGFSIEKLFSQLLSETPKHFHHRLKTLLAAQPRAKKRFLNQIKKELVFKWMAAINPVFDRIIFDLKEFENFIKKQGLGKVGAIAKIVHNLPVCLLDIIVTETNYNRGYIEGIIRKWVVQIMGDQTKIISSKEKPQHLKNTAWYKAFKTEIEKPKKEKITKENIFFLTFQTLLNNIDHKDKENVLMAIDSEKSQQESIDLKETKADYLEVLELETAKGIYAQNAGIILLWPYLGHLYSGLKWMKEGSFVSEDTHKKALFILHFLATGKQQAEEQLLFVPKIFCGFNMETELPYECKLSRYEKKEGEKLLETAIQNWPVLKSTSPDGLREAFLQRHALIKKQGENWHFHFERKGMDVLIDKLPFGISMVKLSWLDYLIHVTW